MSRKRVFVCSPLRESADFSVEENLKLAQRLCHAVVRAGNAPLAPHLFYTQFLDDGRGADRAAGIECGLRWLAVSDELWVYAAELGQCSDGMVEEIEAAHGMSLPPKVVFMPPEFEAVAQRKKRTRQEPEPRIEGCLTCRSTGKTSILGFPAACDVCDGYGRVEV